MLLSSFALDSDDAKERIVEVDNAVESIVRFLGHRLGERKLAVALLLELSRSESVRDCIGKVRGCILLLVTMSSSDDIQAARDASELLENLSFSDHNIIQMAKPNYFKHLLLHLSSGSFLKSNFPFTFLKTGDVPVCYGGIILIEPSFVEC